ncbi:TPA: hypothetical protein N0F65_007991 [Lagenidium giganteum]|uniref:FYVE-type domain-containing protein n=1 Tax=Lagenidium giganteum TaxID=4803 RepID=A0AAV2YRH7_9STRA|nr:TPA: hypothetical protein N0F65_007991 [Lagenidium giganteum]
MMVSPTLSDSPTDSHVSLQPDELYASHTMTMGARQTHHYKEGIRLAEMGEWDVLVQRLRAEPQLARHKDHHGMLPLHWACTEDDVDPDVIRALLHAFPEAALTKNNAQYLPIHIAVRAMASEDTLRVLCDARPSSLIEETPTGKTPVMLAHDVRLPRRSLQVLENAERGYMEMTGEEHEPEDLADVKREVELQSKLLRQSMMVRPQAPSFQPPRPSRMTLPPNFAMSPTESPSKSTIIDEGSEFGGSKRETESIAPSASSSEFSTGACAVCCKKFSLFRKKYQCKGCCAFLCKKHVAGKLELPGFQKKRSVCGDCYRAHRQAIANINVNAVQRATQPSFNDETRVSRADSTPTVLGRNSSFVVGPQTHQRFSANSSALRPTTAAFLMNGSRSSSTASLTDSDRNPADVAGLMHRMAALEERNKMLTQRVAEQDKQYNEAMLLLTETMTRVAELEIRLPESKREFGTSTTSEQASEDGGYDFEFPTPFVEKFD